MSNRSKIAPRRLRVVCYLLLLVCGMLCIAFPGHHVMQAFGGALVGVGLPLLISSFLGSEVDDVASYLFDGEHFGSDKTTAKPYAVELHLYHVSQDSDERFWQYERCKLDFDERLGTLKGRTSLVGKKESRQDYKIDAAVRSDRLVLIARAEASTEAHAIAVVKGVAVAHQEIFCGVEFKETFRGLDAITPIVISKKALPEVGSQGRLSAENAEKLDKLWIEKMGNLDIDVLLPGCRQEAESSVASSESDGSDPINEADLGDEGVSS